MSAKKTKISPCQLVMKTAGVLVLNFLHTGIVFFVIPEVLVSFLSGAILCHTAKLSFSLSVHYNLSVVLFIVLSIFYEIAVPVF
jgi:hypothetical protein